MPNSPLTNTRIPDTTYATNVPTDIRNAIYDLEVAGTPRFTTVSARDTAYSNWIAAGGVLSDGRRCYTDDAGYWRRVGGAWVADKITGNISMSSGWAQYNSYFLPSYHLAADGRVTVRGVMARTGASIVVSGTGLTIGTLPAAIRPTSDIQLLTYMGTGSPVTRISATVYFDHTSAGVLQLFSFDSGSYTLNSGTGFVSLDGLTWYI